MLTVNHLRKQFATTLAVDDVSFSVERGEIFGLLGPNGAGKTTTIRMILNIFLPDAGEIRFNGGPLVDETRNRLGYLPEERGLYRKSRVLDTILYFASLRGMPPRVARQEALRWLDRFGIPDYAHRRTDELSKGNQQKIQCIAAIIHDPDLIVLDEPFAGLDPVNQILFTEIMQEMKQRNKAVIFSTHQMDQAEKLSDSLCLINKGRVVLGGTLAEVKRQYGSNTLHIEFDGDGGFLRNLPGVGRALIYENAAELELRGGTRAGAVISAINDRLELRKVELREPSLHAIFLQVVGLPERQTEAEAKRP
jgi:ABC-2 type transport system ATP-binding protein